MENRTSVPLAILTASSPKALHVTLLLVMPASTSASHSRTPTRTSSSTAHAINPYLLSPPRTVGSLNSARTGILDSGRTKRDIWISRDRETQRERERKSKNYITSISAPCNNVESTLRVQVSSVFIEC